MQLSGKGPGNLHRQQAVHELSGVPWQQSHQSNLAVLTAAWMLNQEK